VVRQNKTAIVSGAGSGIGRAIALAYAREGARVGVSDLVEAGGHETVRLIQEGTRGAKCVFVRADASKLDEQMALVQAAIDEYGALHVACNNAGIGGELNPVADLSPEGWQRVIDINLSGVYYAMHAQIPRRLDARGGARVTKAANLGQVGPPGPAGASRVPGRAASAC
jgi:NAD(P)-dependent dehydrogenase (short-subunit alcohol dehydrogenase family)